MLFVTHTGIPWKRRLPSGKLVVNVGAIGRPANDGRWETTLSYEAVVYSDNEHSVPVITKKATTIVDRCRNRRRDFFLADRLILPETLPVGKYVLKVTVVDQQANHVAEKTVPILIAPN